MRVTCNQCNTRYRLDEKYLSRGKIRVKCKRCENIFMVKGSSNELEPTVEPSVSEVENDSTSMSPLNKTTNPNITSKTRTRILIRQENGALKECQDMAKLQRWVIEGDVSRQDQLSYDGDTWTSLGAVSALSSFFRASDRSSSQAPMPHKQTSTLKRIQQQAESTDPAWAQTGKEQEQYKPPPAPLQKDEELPRSAQEAPDPRAITPRVKTKKSRKRVFAVTGLIIIITVGISLGASPQKRQQLWQDVQIVAGNILGYLVIPEEAYEAIKQGQAYLREDSKASYEDAINSFRHALELAKGRSMSEASVGLVEALSHKALLEDEPGPTAELVRHADLAIKKDPDSPGGYRAKAYVALLEGSIQKADVEIARALYRNERDASTYVLRGTLHLKNKDRSNEAITAFRQALAIDSELPRGNYLLAKLLVLQGKIAEAKPYAKQAMDASPKHERAKSLYQEILNGEAGLARAARELDNPDKLISRAYAAYQKGNYKQAVKLYEAIIEIDPEHSEAWALLGLVYLDSGQDDLAEGALAASVNVNPRLAYTYRYQGRLYERKGERNLAIQAFQNYLSLLPTGPASAEVRQKINDLKK